MVLKGGMYAEYFKNIAKGYLYGIKVNHITFPTTQLVHDHLTMVLGVILWVWDPNWFSASNSHWEWKDTEPNGSK